MRVDSSHGRTDKGVNVLRPRSHQRCIVEYLCDDSVELWIHSHYGFSIPGEIPPQGNLFEHSDTLLKLWIRSACGIGPADLGAETLNFEQKQENVEPYPLAMQALWIMITCIHHRSAGKIPH